MKVLFLKSHIKGHNRRNPDGSSTFIADHDDKRVKKPVTPQVPPLKGMAPLGLGDKPKVLLPAAGQKDMFGAQPDRIGDAAAREKEVAAAGKPSGETVHPDHIEPAGDAGSEGEWSVSARPGFPEDDRMKQRRLEDGALDLSHKDAARDFHIRKEDGQHVLDEFNSEEKDPDKAHIGSSEHASESEAVAAAHDAATHSVRRRYGDREARHKGSSLE